MIEVTYLIQESFSDLIKWLMGKPATVTLRTFSFSMEELAGKGLWELVEENN